MRIATCLFGLMMAAPVFADTQVIQWNYNNGASALGSGCSAGDTQFIASGNEISVVFSKLGVELTGSAGGVKAAKKTCRIIIPTKVRSGFYLGTLSQTLTYGYERNAGTEGTVSVASEFYNQAAGSMERKIPTPGLDEWSVSFAQANASSNWRVLPGWCQRTDYVGNFKANLSVNGYRSAVNRDIVIQIDGHDIRFEALGTPLLCPR